MSSFLTAHHDDSAARRLRSALAEPGVTIAPGAYDGLGARLVEQAGFPAVYLTGFGVSASVLGRPDVGLTTFSEMVDSVRRVVRATSLPVIADADTGYGGPLNVMRTVEEYESAGAAGLHIEDQVLPKRCGHMENKEVVATSEFAAKIAAAAQAKADDDFLVIARTDARGPNGLPDALERGRAARDSGADMLFVEALETVAELETCAAAFPDIALLYNAVDGGKSPRLSAEELAELGFSLMIAPVSLLLAATGAMQRALAEMSRTGALPAAPDPDFHTFNELIGLAEIDELGRPFS